MKTSELTGAALDWAVATIEGYTELHRMKNRWDHEPHLAMYPPRREYGVVEMWQLGFSTDWACAGPIIEREEIEMNIGSPDKWVASIGGEREIETGPTPLIAAMRCYIASRLGDEVNIPKELQ